MSNRCLVIAEVAQAHDGSLGMAHAFVDAAKAAGADMVKFQMHFASEESTPQEPWRVAFSRQDQSRYEYWQRMEFSETQWHELKAHCDEAGITFLCSPFSLRAVEILKKIGMPAWKIASGEVLGRKMFDAMAEAGWPMFVSTGMIGWEDIRRVVKQVQERNLELVLFQCTTAYPTPPKMVGLNVIEMMRQEFGCRVGLSDHSGQIYAGLAAATLGVDALEVHITWHRGAFGPDVPASLTLEDLATLVQGVRAIETMHANPVDKDELAAELQPLRQKFGKSLVAKTSIRAGEIIAHHHLALKKPGAGLPEDKWDEIVGRTAVRDLAKDEFILEKDVA
ncbi:MAG: N-acetylneuraminate synthase family protein [Chthonomonas sp.]|nr:N-acetylneuraminate synthase family protein [Chthonomonas sp.]